MLLLVAVASPAFSSDAIMQPLEPVSDRLFTVLPGSWKGLAVETPVGPVNYPIHFHECNHGVLAGIAELSVSDHYWQFWLEVGEPRLTFLSTFRGNREPVQLVVSRMEANVIHFHAPDLELLSLAVTLAEPNIDIRVFHNEQPHVYIRLTRTETRAPRKWLDENKDRSCLKLGD